MVGVIVGSCASGLFVGDMVVGDLVPGRRVGFPVGRTVGDVVFRLVGEGDGNSEGKRDIPEEETLGMADGILYFGRV